jgi:chemotaxis protein methyltransferase CheR
MKANAEAGVDSLKKADFERLASFIHRVAGIKMPPSKHSMVEGRLRRRVVATGASGFDEYCNQVFAAGEHSEEIINLVDAVTTNKTDFFREPAHFDILAKIVLPGLDLARRPVKIWSAACSVGAEPYTLAMVVSEYAHAQPARAPASQPPSILGTDLCTAVLETARRGIYPAAMAAPIPIDMRRRYLLRGKGSQAGSVRIVPQLRAMVRFAQLNLMAPNYNADAGFDIIFCRNVLIYFDRAGQKAVLNRLCARLAQGGVLAVGHSEAVHNLDLPLQAIGHTIFRKT